MKTSTKGSGDSVFLVSACRSRASLRSAAYGEMKEVSAMVVLSAKSLATCRHEAMSVSFNSGSRLVQVYLSNPADVLFSVLRRESEVLVQTKSHIVAVESVGLQTKVEEVLLEGNGNGGLARSREPGKPDGAALLLAKVAAFGASEACVPGDVAVGLGQICLSVCTFCWRGHGGVDSGVPAGIGTYVAILMLVKN